MHACMCMSRHMCKTLIHTSHYICIFGMYVFLYVVLSGRMFVCMRVGTLACMHAYMHMFMHACMYACMCACLQYATSPGSRVINAPQHGRGMCRRLLRYKPALYICKAYRCVSALRLYRWGRPYSHIPPQPRWAPPNPPQKKKTASSVYVGRLLSVPVGLLVFLLVPVLYLWVSW